MQAPSLFLLYGGPARKQGRKQLQQPQVLDGRQEQEQPEELPQPQVQPLEVELEEEAQVQEEELELPLDWQEVLPQAQGQETVQLEQEQHMGCSSLSQWCSCAALPPGTSYAGGGAAVRRGETFCFTNSGAHGIIHSVQEIGVLMTMANAVLTSVYFFFFFCFTYYMGKAYLGFTEERRNASQRA